MIWASSLYKLKPSTVSSKVALRYFMILSAHDYSILQYRSIQFGAAQEGGEYKQMICAVALLTYLALVQNLKAYQWLISLFGSFWIFGPFWSGVHQQGPGSLQISTAEAPSPWQTSRAPQGANDSFVWSRGYQACFTKKEESPHEVETFFKDTGCVKQNFELQVKTIWVGFTSVLRSYLPRHQMFRGHSLAIPTDLRRAGRSENSIGEHGLEEDSEGKLMEMEMAQKWPKIAKMAKMAMMSSILRVEE